MKTVLGAASQQQTDSHYRGIVALEDARNLWELSNPPHVLAKRLHAAAAERRPEKLFCSRAVALAAELAPCECVAILCCIQADISLSIADLQTVALPDNVGQS